ncbi:hypothetical protein LR48_Vigan08g035900 [Vigna angularis]|uniref:Putative plant transposon protein domain-containing protein n=1 Tax=Phaseolus angularis TaxID=3914 RepID=A0A0L9V3P8_PHAAN|nr:hypothetical protein LR48_Vigan08g035900 [Vigna angularis]
MASESNPPQRDANLEGWISDTQEQHEFLQFWKERKVLKQNFIDLQWFTSYGFNFPHLIVEQDVQYLMELRGSYYPDLVQVFYYNLKVHDDIFHTRVKGVDIVLDNDFWANVAKIPLLENSQIIPSDFDKILVYQSFLRSPQQLQNNRLFLVGGLKMEERLLHYRLVWLLCPRGSNHAQCSEVDLVIMYGILQSIPINWPHLIQSIMYKAKRLDSAPLPYPLLVCRICEYKGVNVSNEQVEHVLPNHKIGDNSLRQMGFIKNGNLYIHVDDVGALVDEDEEDIPMLDPTHVAGPSHVQEEFSMASLYRQMFEMARLENARHEEICTHLKKIDERISSLEKHFQDSDAF